MKIVIIIVSIIVISLLVYLFVVANNRGKEENGMETTIEHSPRELNHYEKTYSEDNFQELADLFEKLKEQLNDFILALEENESLMVLEWLDIFFLGNEELHQEIGRNYQVHIHEGEIIRGVPEYLINQINEDTNLFSSMRKWSEQRVFSSVNSLKRTSAGEDVWYVAFSIHPEQLSFLEMGSDDVRASFIYLTGSFPLGGKTKEVESGWHIQIDVRE